MGTKRAMPGQQENEPFTTLCLMWEFHWCSKKRGAGPWPDRKMGINQKPESNIRPDMLFVIGLQDEVTALTESLCEEVGLRVHFAMKKSDPTKRIESLNDEAVIMPPLPEDQTVFVCGLKAAEMLNDFEGGPLDCNWTGNDASAFVFPLTCWLHEAADIKLPVPEGWVLKDIPERPEAMRRHDERWERELRESECRNHRVGYFGPFGTVVADFGHGRQLLQLPQMYNSIFPMIEEKGHYL